MTDVGGKTRLLPAVKSRMLLSLHLFYAEESAFRRTECKRHRVFWSPEASAPPGGLNRGEKTGNIENVPYNSNEKDPLSNLLKASYLVQRTSRNQQRYLCITTWQCMKSST